MAEAAVAEAPAEEPVKKGKGKLLVIVGVAIAVLAAGGGAAWYFMAGSDKKAEDTKHAKAEPAKKGPALYIALEPPFVVNFKQQALLRFLQVSMQVMTRDPATQTLLKENDPAVRNELLSLLGNLDYDTISTTEGKEALRQQALTAVRKIVTDEGGKATSVEAVYFTSFVMQ